MELFCATARLVTEMAMTNLSQDNIGQLFDNRDHSTVIHSIRQVEQKRLLSKGRLSTGTFGEEGLTVSGYNMQTGIRSKVSAGVEEAGERSMLSIRALASTVTAMGFFFGMAFR